MLLFMRYLIFSTSSGPFIFGMLVVDKDKLVHGGFLFEVEVIQAACDEVGSIYAADR